MKKIYRYLAPVNLAFFTIVCLLTSQSLADKGRGNSLPPGLEKRQAQGKPLPPGWQKKLSVGDELEASVYARGSVVVPLGSDGSITIEVEGVVLKLHEATRKIIAIVD